VGVYKCEAVQISETDLTAVEYTKEYRRHCRLYRPELLTVTKHSLNQRHCKHFEETAELGTLTHYKGRVIRVAIEISLHPNVYRKGGYLLNRDWKIVHTLEHQTGCYSNTNTTKSVLKHQTSAATP
jgi:hypothetical protein